MTGFCMFGLCLCVGSVRQAWHTYDKRVVKGVHFMAGGAGGKSSKYQRPHLEGNGSVYPFAQHHSLNSAGP